MISTKNNYKTLYLMLIAYTFFAFLTPLSSIFFVILCALVVFSVFLLNDSDTLCFLAFASCFMSCFNIESMFLKMLELVMTILLIRQLVVAIKQKDKKNIIFVTAILGLCLILFIYGLILTKFHIYKWWQSFGVILAIASIYLFGKIDIKKVVLILSLGLIVSSLCSTLAYFSGVLAKPPFIPDDIAWFRFSAYFNYVNALALYCSLCQACILTLFLTNQLDIKKWFWLPVVITLIGLLTFSKSFISITIFTYVVAIILGLIHSKNKKRYIKYLLIGVVAIAILILLCHSYIETIIKRFLDISDYDGALNIATTGRVDIWKKYFKHIFSNPLYVLFGCGITADSVGEYTPHNLFISILYRFGIVGIMALIAIVVFIVKQSKLSKHISNYLPLLVVIINACFEDISSSLFTCLPLVIAIFFIIHKKTIKK